MEKFVKLGTERIRLSEIKSYTTFNDELWIETENDYFSYTKEEVDNYDTVIKYLDDNLTINASKIDATKLSPMNAVASLDITWDDILKGNIFNNKNTAFTPISVYSAMNADNNIIDKLNAINHMMNLMKDNIPGFNSYGGLFKFSQLIEFNDYGFIKRFNLPKGYWGVKYDLISPLNYLMIEIVKHLYGIIIDAKLLDDIPSFGWDVEDKIWQVNGNLRIEREDISLILRLLSGELFDEIGLTEGKQILIDRTSQKIIDTYFELAGIYIGNFMIEDIPANIEDEVDPYNKFIMLRAAFCDVINMQCRIGLWVYE